MRRIYIRRAVAIAEQLSPVKMKVLNVGTFYDCSKDEAEGLVASGHGIYATRLSDRLIVESLLSDEFIESLGDKGVADFLRAEIDAALKARGFNLLPETIMSADVTGTHIGTLRQGHRTFHVSARGVA